jgi:hypothetical protein
MIYEKKLALIQIVPLARYLLPCQFFSPIQKKSILLDLKIMLKTVFIVVTGHGAY